VGYEDEEMFEEIELVGEYLDYPIVPRIPMKFLSQEKKEVRPMFGENRRLVYCEPVKNPKKSVGF
jgi:hypothetical protein